MNPCVRFAAIIPAAFLMACAAPHSPRMAATPVREGMTGAQLTAQFGAPLEVQRHKDGSEDWIYQFGSQQRESHRISTSSASESERSQTTGQETTTTTSMHRAPVRLSAAGRVIGKIPAGSVVAE